MSGENAHAFGDEVGALRLEGVTKDFGGLRAVDRVTLRVAPGERRAIIGPNGAGKTTLFNLITGELPVTEGRIYLFGHDITELPPHRRIALGLGRTYQITNIFPRLSVEKNVLLAAQGLSSVKFAPFQPLPERGDIRERVERALEAVGLQHARSTPARELSHGEQRQLELALALAGSPKVLLLDEPAAGLASAERAMMARLIQSLPRTLTIVLIEHDMDLALGLVDKVTVLHFGQVLAEDVPERIRQNATVQEVYLGVG